MTNEQATGLEGVSNELLNWAGSIAGFVSDYGETRATKSEAAGTAFVLALDLVERHPEYASAWLRLNRAYANKGPDMLHAADRLVEAVPLSLSNEPQP